MYNTGSKQFILRQSNGEVWNFYYDQRYGLCYSTLTKRNTWTNPVTLHKNAYQAFYADMDTEDRFHILFQDTQGNIHYSLMDGNSIKTIPVLNSKAPAAYDKHLFLLPFKNNLHFFYVLRHDSSPLFAYQVLSDDKLSNPKVIDYVTDSICPCSIIYDKSQNIFAFYQSTDGKYLQLGYKKYNISKKMWSEFIPVTRYQGNCEYPRAVTDSSGLFHLCYQRRVNKQFEMVYLQKMPDKNIWGNETVTHTSGYPFENSSIFWVDDNVIIYWVREDIIYYSLGSHSGNIWEKPVKYNFPTTHRLACMSYKSNNAYESDKIVVREIPGSLVGGLKFAFYQYPSENGDNLSADELRNLILDSLKMLKSGLEDLKETDAGLRDDLNKCSNGQTELEKDMVKYSVRLDYLEGQIKNFKNLSSRIDELATGLKEMNSRLEQLGPKEEI